MPLSRAAVGYSVAATSQRKRIPALRKRPGCAVVVTPVHEHAGPALVEALRQPGFRALGVLLIVAAVVTTVAVVALWPSGTNEAVENDADNESGDAREDSYVDRLNLAPLAGFRVVREAK